VLACMVTIVCVLNELHEAASEPWLQGTVTSCRKNGNKLLFHVNYDDGDAEVETLGEEGTVFKWHGPRACSGDPPFKGTMRDAMVLLQPQNLQDTPDPTAEVRFIPTCVACSHLPSVSFYRAFVGLVLSLITHSRA
jgi:hypothetical protein